MGLNPSQMGTHIKDITFMGNHMDEDSTHGQIIQYTKANL